MKVIVQIPCLNEEATLPQTVADIPRRIEGVDRVEIMVIDDGSTDRTVEVARALGVEHIVRNKSNLGLARTFRNGLDAALRLGADIIVNTDADNQYRGADIAKLVRPILEGKADIVIGDRQTDRIDHFSPMKKRLQRMGTRTVRWMSGTDIADAVSGFRAFSRDAALRINVLSVFSYTIETIIQAGKKHITIANVPVGTNPKTRDSRLFKSIPKFIERSFVTLIRVYSMYQPLRFFVAIGAVFIVVGAIPMVRFLVFYVLGHGEGHLQSLIFGASFLIIGALTFLFGLLADLVNFNRQLIEVALEKIRRVELRDEGVEIEPAARVFAASKHETTPGR